MEKLEAKTTQIKNPFPLIHLVKDDGCANCTYEVKFEELTPLLQKLAIAYEKHEMEFGVPFRCVICQCNMIVSLNGDGLNAETLKKWGWIELKD